MNKLPRKVRAYLRRNGIKVDSIHASGRQKAQGVAKKKKRRRRTTNISRRRNR